MLPQRDAGKVYGSLLQCKDKYMASATVSPSSTPFANTMKLLLANWPIAPERVQGIRELFFPIYQQVGAERFSRAAYSIIDSRAYTTFPNVSEFKGFVPSAEFKRKYCGECNEGWIRVEDEEATMLYGTPTYAVKRCRCMRRK